MSDKQTLVDWQYPEGLLAIRGPKVPPVTGARPVYWRSNGSWVHKGWIMPEARHG